MIKLTTFFGMALAMLISFVSAETSINMKALILTTKENAKTDNSIPMALQSYGIPYDMITFIPTDLPKGNLTLVDENERPLYNLIIANSGTLSYVNVDTGLWVSSLTRAQWAHLHEYEVKYGVRQVNIDDTVLAENYVTLFKDNEWGRTKPTQPLIIADNAETNEVFNATRVLRTAPLDVNGIYHTRINITDETIVKPFLYYAEEGQKGAVAATISKFTDGREVMSFYFAFGSWSQTCIMLNHLWITWGTRSLYNGFRRVYFTPHIDDVFLSSDLVDLKNNLQESENSEIFRTSKSDYEHIAQFQKDILKVMPEGSFYQVELAFNGNGILLEIDYDKALEVDGERYVDLEFVKTPGTGETRWPKANYTLSSSFTEAYLKKDKLFSYFANNEATQKNFFWSSHTFSHENLDNAAKSDADNEIRVNIEMAKKLGLVGKDYYSEHAIVTPQISGLHNKDVLDVFKQYGINAATGDLSRPVITNLENPYLPYYTTMESSNFVGFPVIPRTPTEIYYLCSSRDENTWMYNHIYHDYFGNDSTWDEIAERESKRTLLLMTKLRHEAHQFHQANLRYYATDSEKKYGNSLLEDWTRAVVNLYVKYVDWPLISMKIDDIMESFIRRAELEACGQVSRLLLNENNEITGISVTATEGSCQVPITVPRSVKESSLPEGSRLEQIGSDPLTVWVSLAKGETKTIELAEPLAWKN